MTMLRFAEEQEPKSIEERKKQLHIRMKQRRANNENRDVKETLLIENTLATLERYQGGEKTVFCYLSYSSEAPTDGLIEALLERGYKIYCPRVVGKEMQAVEYGEDFTVSSLRIREPVGEPFNGKVRFAIVPFLAVDKQGNRLGYGGGYYDRYFEKNPDTLRIAYGFDFQIQNEVPTAETDKKMDCIVTDKQALFINN
ncbi:MAG: 5-formyltetrahydrofolate cyclo-ligase [Clostridia bacterium]|nr:5-formyltetrahydrofolate cyclo-ligase [Clostridia bacterium]